MSSTDKRKVTADDIENLLEIFKQSGWDEMHLQTGELEIFLSNDPAAQGPRAAAAPAAAPVAASTPVAVAAGTPAAPIVISAAGPSGHAPIPAGQVAIKAPNLGTFYRSPKPGAEPYVEVGQQIETTTEVCLIEVMKLFTPVQGGVKGIVREIRARDGQMVEFDEVLIVVEPN
ncbi:MAG: acetyl-CoA carboxylase biotin carboxyl carrier protein [Gammaproteobacteria bacterium]|nr:acetyl-CoA carboxylase biotin carboxyl carrier protein [Gammaproteobacteria bacterium]